MSNLIYLNEKQLFFKILLLGKDFYFIELKFLHFLAESWTLSEGPASLGQAALRWLWNERTASNSFVWFSTAEHFVADWIKTLGFPFKTLRKTIKKNTRRMDEIQRATLL